MCKPSKQDSRNMNISTLRCEEYDDEYSVHVDNCQYTLAAPDTIVEEILTDTIVDELLKVKCEEVGSETET